MTAAVLCSYGRFCHYDMPSSSEASVIQENAILSKPFEDFRRIDTKNNRMILLKF